MIRTLLRLVLLLILVAAVAAFFVGYRMATRSSDTVQRDPVIGTTGSSEEPAIDVERARETGARIGESLAVGAERAERAATDAALTAKIKSKMALDDNVRAMAIDVDTNRGVVTLRGSVPSAEVRERAVRLALETDGVIDVRDLLTAGR
jgi:hyperosmotically inducible protein